MIHWFEFSSFDEIIELFSKIDCNDEDEKRKVCIRNQLVYSWVYSFWSIQVDGCRRFKDEVLYCTHVFLSHLFDCSQCVCKEANGFVLY